MIEMEVRKSSAGMMGITWVCVFVFMSTSAWGSVVFEVQHKFGGRQNSLLKALRAHDSHRHGRMLGVLDLPLGGDGRAEGNALYYTRLGIGTPSNDFHVQVDTGSDILWVNCAGCENCPTKTEIGIKLKQFDIKTSTTGERIGCGKAECGLMMNAPQTDCKPGALCEYLITYGDSSQTMGYFVNDTIKFESISGNPQNTSMTANIAFGCSAKQSSDPSSTAEAVDGILGFGQANSSMISQLAAAGKVKKIFAHCLNGNGGGIFAVGQIVDLKVNTTPLVPNQQHYNAILKEIDVGGQIIRLPRSLFGLGTKNHAIIDSGTTLAYLPDEIFGPVMQKVMSKHSDLEIHTVDQQFKCFYYPGNVDADFPVMTLNFQDSVALKVYPHDYLFEIENDEWCVGWMNSGTQTKDGDGIILLGDLVLSNKLVLYDLEKQSIGWTDYNCSSHIKIKDEQSGNVYTVGAHDISSANCPISSKMLTFLLLVSVLRALI